MSTALSPLLIYDHSRSITNTGQDLDVPIKDTISGLHPSIHTCGVSS